MAVLQNYFFQFPSPYDFTSVQQLGSHNHQQMRITNLKFGLLADQLIVLTELSVVIDD